MYKSQNDRSNPHQGEEYDGSRVTKKRYVCSVQRYSSQQRSLAVVILLQRFSALLQGRCGCICRYILGETWLLRGETQCRLSATHEVTAASVGRTQDTQRLIPHTFTAFLLLSRGQMYRHAQLRDVTPSCDKLDQHSAVRRWNRRPHISRPPDFDIDTCNSSFDSIP